MSYCKEILKDKISKKSMMVKLNNNIFVCLFIFFTTFFSCQDLIGNVSVDFNKKQSVNSTVGFLHFNDINRLEKDIKELKPKYWRFRFRDKTKEIVNTLSNNDVKSIIVISDRYGYTDDPNWMSPLESNRYKNTVKEIYSELGNTVIYDPWNEPYMRGFGEFSSKDFFQVFKQAHDMIRSLPGGKDASITGPSFHEFKRNEIEDFFKFCSKNNITFDILSWHDWRNQADLKAMESDIAWVKDILLPKYPTVGVKKIVLTEVVHAYIQFSPTQVYAVYEALEKSKIDGACRGCFAESDGTVNCENNSMTGLLDSSGNRRSIWWATKLYTQSMENRVLSNTNLENFVSFASHNKNNAYLLLANNTSKEIKNTKVSLNLRGLSILKNNTRLKVSFYKIPDTGENLLEKPIFVSSKLVSAKGNTLTFDIKVLPSQEILYFTITK